MSDTLQTFQDTVHHTVMDTVKYIGVVMNNTPQPKDYSALIISLCAVLISAYGVFLTYRMRKKDFQSALFNKQFEAYDNLLIALHNNYDLLKLHFEEYSIGNIAFGEFQHIVENDRKEFFESIRNSYLFHREVITALQFYIRDVNSLIYAEVPKDKIEGHIKDIIFKKLLFVENKVRSILAIDKLSQDTFNFITAKKKIDPHKEINELERK
jgi:hypothetical protein